MTPLRKLLLVNVTAIVLILSVELIVMEFFVTNNYQELQYSIPSFGTNVWNRSELERVTDVLVNISTLITTKTTKSKHKPMHCNKANAHDDNHSISKHFDAIFIITLPERRQSIIDIMLNHYGFDKHKLIIFDAIESSTIHNNISIAKMIELNILSNTTTWNSAWGKRHQLHTFDEISCTLSHMAVFHHIYSDECIDKALIFEDDIAKQNNLYNALVTFDESMNRINNIDADWELINFGRCFDYCEQDKLINSFALTGVHEQTNIVTSLHALCTHSYGISSKGIDTLLNSGELLPISRSIDYTILEIYGLQVHTHADIYNYHHYSVSPTLFFQNRTIESKIRKNRTKTHIECQALPYRFCKKLRKIWHRQLFKTIPLGMDPFRKGWYFDDYKSIVKNTQNIKTKPILKLKLSYLLIHGFKHPKQNNKNINIPFYNPSIIRIDDIHNYQNFMLASITSNNLSQIVKKTKYILIGRWSNNQCRKCQNDQKRFNVTARIRKKLDVVGSGILLLDNNWNILQYVMLTLITDEENENYFKILDDCRLFAYLSYVFTSCSVWKEGKPIGQHITFNGALLWKESEINKKLHIVAYLDSKIDNVFKTRMLNHVPDYIYSKLYGIGKESDGAKNLLPLVYQANLYFQWSYKHTYFVQNNLLKTNKRNASYAYHNPQSILFNNFITHRNGGWGNRSYSLNIGFIYLPESNEYLGVGHRHYDLYDYFNMDGYYNNFGIKWGYHYTHFFYTLSGEPPFYIKRMSEEFCILSPYNHGNDCEIIQFILGMIQETIDDVDYLFISYGIDDCISVISKIEKQFVIDMLKPVGF